jgi:hypothetical protein
MPGVRLLDAVCRQEADGVNAQLIECGLYWFGHDDLLDEFGINESAERRKHAWVDSPIR